MRGKNEDGFAERYAQARNEGYMRMADEILDVARTQEEGTTVIEGPKGTTVRTGDMTEHRRLKIDTMKWVLAKALPKLYGDRVQLDHSTQPQSNIIDIDDMSAEDRQALREILERQVQERQRRQAAAGSVAAIPRPQD